MTNAFDSNTTKPRTVAFGAVAPHRVARAVRFLLDDRGYEVIDVSPSAGSSPAWPAVGRHVAELVADKKAATGIALCWTGSGVSISASTVPGIRSAFCSSGTEAREAREWHDANVLALSLMAPEDTLLSTVREWLEACPSQAPEHLAARRDFSAIAVAI
jgi:ribose 5-phosphate isomerase B